MAGLPWVRIAPTGPPARNRSPQVLQAGAWKVSWYHTKLSKHYHFAELRAVLLVENRGHHQLDGLTGFGALGGFNVLLGCQIRFILLLCTRYQRLRLLNAVRSPPPTSMIAAVAVKRAVDAFWRNECCNKLRLFWRAAWGRGGGSKIGKFKKQKSPDQLLLATRGGG